MSAPAGGRIARIVAALLAAVAIGAGAFYALRTPDPPPSPAPDRAAEPKPSLQLYCQFYVFTEQRPRLALLFEVEARDGGPAFEQIYLAEDNGNRADYDGASEPRPLWAYDAAADPKTISSKIMVPDSSQAGQHEEDILIQLYDYRPDRDAKAFLEASLKNIHFQNLPGKCRQSRG